MPRRPHVRASVPFALALLLATGCSAAQDPATTLATADDLQKDFASVPCDDKDRLAAVRALYERAGASASDITLDQTQHRHRLFQVFVNFDADALLGAGQGERKIFQHALA